MPSWRPQLYKQNGINQGVEHETLVRALEVAKAIREGNSRAVPIFTLRHLAHCADVNYRFLRSVVERQALDPYRVFRIRKRQSKGQPIRYRVICVPSPHLMKAQRWIVHNILTVVAPHKCSVAYSKGSRLIDAAERHCGAKWLIKLDIQNFFESINEIAIYRIFRKLKYQPLMSFELARLCTKLGTRSSSSPNPKWHVWPRTEPKIKAYEAKHIGHLPQGAPTSPMLANLACIQVDAAIEAIATHHKLRYTRYADDMTFSTESADFNRARAARFIGSVYRILADFGLSPNATKTTVVSPRGRKVVLGLLVDTDTPRLTREFRATVRQHVYFLTRDSVGPVAHAQRRGFASTTGLRNHLDGLISFAKQIDSDFATRYELELAKVTWPI